MSTKPRLMFGTKDTASCLQVMRALQSYLDNELDDVNVRRIANHLDACRRCGLEAATYSEMKAVLNRSAHIDPHALDRLRAFGASLASGRDNGSGQQGTPL